MEWEQAKKTKTKIKGSGGEKDIGKKTKIKGIVKEKKPKSARTKEAVKGPEENQQAEKTQEVLQKTGKQFDPWSVLQYPHLAEKSMRVVEAQNKLVFIVDRRANKDMIATAIEKEFNVVVKSVNTEITSKGLKKAYVKLSEKYSAGDIATRLGMV